MKVQSCYVQHSPLDITADANHLIGVGSSVIGSLVSCMPFTVKESAFTHREPILRGHETCPARRTSNLEQTFQNRSSRYSRCA